MVITLGMISGFMFAKDSYGIDVTNIGWLPLASLIIYVLGFSVGFGPIPWLMMGEILPAKIRGTAASVATGFNWSITFLVTKTFGTIAGNLNCLLSIIELKLIEYQLICLLQRQLVIMVPLLYFV